jgi:dolichyl-phosphate beta-glucosyltransferase
MTEFPYIFSIVIPAYNEEKRILKSIKTIEETLFKYSYEIIVVSDGSTDKTINIVSKHNSEHIKLIILPQNTGKGNAVKQGFLKAQGQYVVMTDADLSTPINTLLSIVSEIKYHDVVIGSRLISSEGVHHGPLSRRLLRRATKHIRHLLFDIEITDTQCGFKIFKNHCAKQIAQQSKIKGYGADLEKLILARSFGYSIKEIAVPWKFDQENSKINIFTDSFKTLTEWFRIKINLIFKKY